MENTSNTPTRDADTYCFGTAAHDAFLRKDAKRQFAFFRASVSPEPGYFVLDYTGDPLADTVQELHTTTRLTHSFALGKLAGLEGCDAVLDKGRESLWSDHRDRKHGG